ncbi:MAG TPA: MaoC/PaaZ C-terminal domain-containing protein [Rubrivivax sp.]|nr:MaoC/PaaZ C-terminal domain-containing protein [Rubrivivax sp.]
MSGFFAYARLGEHHYRERFGLAFEEFSVGQVFEHRPGLTVTQQDNLEEALDTLNNAQLHYDLHYAAQTEWQRNLGVSTLTLQRLLGMSSRTFYRRRRLLGFSQIAMTHPVFGGDTLYARTSVLAKDDGDADAGVLSLLTEGLNQRGEAVAQLHYRAELYRAGRHPEDQLLAGAPLAEEERFRLYHPAAVGGALVEQCGLYFEDFAAGESFEHWPGKTVSAAESATHALRSLEINPRYADAAYAAAVLQRPVDIFEPFVPGLVTALTTRTFGRVVANLGWTDIELPRPLRAGETIRCTSTIGQTRPSAHRPTQGIVNADTVARGGDGDVVCRFKRAFLVYKRGLGPYAAAGY